MRIVPSVQQATTRDWPARDVGRRQHRGRPAPRPNADSAGGPSWRVRCPPTIGHVVQRAGGAACPRGPPGRGLVAADHRVDDARAAGAHGGQVVDVGEHGREPRAVRVGATKAGSIASPQAMTCPSPASDAATVPGTGRPRRRRRARAASCRRPSTSADQPDLGLGPQRRVGAQVARELLELRALSIPRAGSGRATMASPPAVRCRRRCRRIASIVGKWMTYLL